VQTYQAATILNAEGRRLSPPRQRTTAINNRQPEELYTIGPHSSALGQPCAACGRPFELNDVITWYPWPPEQRTERFRVQALHLRCLPAGEQ
jgi:hypothetical protein